MRRPVTALYCVMLKDSSLVFADGVGPEISFQVCLWVLIRPCHIAICWLSIQHFMFFKKLPRPVQVQQTGDHFPVPHDVQGPRTVPQNAGWKCSLPFGTSVPVGTLFGSLKGFQGCLTVRTNTDIFLWSSIHLNFIRTDQDGIHKCRTM